MNIRTSTQADRIEIEKIHTQTFGEEKGPEIADLVDGLFDDPSATPFLSLVAVEDGRLIGHILYTSAVLTGTGPSASIRLLAPLAVLPGAQARGVGSRLIEEGLRQLKAAEVDLVFVLGHPDYYPRCGFTPAGVLGFDAPYPIPGPTCRRMDGAGPERRGHRPCKRDGAMRGCAQSTPALAGIIIADAVSPQPSTWPKYSCL